MNPAELHRQDLRNAGRLTMAESETGNLFAHLPTTLPEELVTVLAESRHVRIERIVSTGHGSPAGFWYDQEEHEWVVVLKGEARLVFAGDQEPIHLKPGDQTLIPAHRKHRVEWTTPNEPTLWLAVFYR
jgi:cupin 2 domain-containing protein